jgi:anthranilate phosphoribosyltransferase
VVLANAGGALYAADKAGSLRDGVLMAARSIDEGNAGSVLEKFVELSQTLD